jgi:protein subunit release factor A
MGFVADAADAATAARVRRDALLKIVEHSFRPEFINRLDKIVIFQPLGVDEMRKIARRELGKALLREGVLRRNILLDFREEVLDVLVAAGFSPTYGARPLQRAIKDTVLMPLARKIAAQPAAGEQLLELCVRDGQIAAEIIPSGSIAQLQQAEPEEPRERLSVREASSGRARAMDLHQLAAAIASLRQRVEAHIASERYQGLQAYARRLLAEVGQPAFWDDQRRSRQTLSAINHLEQVTDQFTDLASRIEGLSEVANMIRVHNDVAGLRELGTRFEALDRDVALAELKLVAGQEETLPLDAAFICLTPLVAPRARPAGDWVEQLRAMYTAWAQLQGYEVEVISPAHPSGGATAGSAPASAIPAASATAGSGATYLLLRGPSAQALLRGEEGIHKLQREPASAEQARGASGGRRASQVQLARVEVLPVPPTEPEQLPFQLEDVRVSVVPPPARARRAASPRTLAEAIDQVSGLRVCVAAQDAEHVALALLAARTTRPSKSSGLAGGDEVARIYCLAPTQYVRDPRTNHREGRPREVLEGHIDAFLYAYLSQQRHPAPVVPGDANGQGEQVATALLAAVFGKEFESK